MMVLPKFCSQKCNGVYRTKNKKGITNNYSGVCEQCGKKFETYRSPSNFTKNPRFCSLKCTGKAQSGENNPAYTGGRYINADGYVVIFMPNHPNSGVRKTVFEHRLSMECKIGRYLTKEECVHHIDGNKSNNDPNNLMLFKNNSEHIKFHAKLKRNGKKSARDR